MSWKWVEHTADLAFEVTGSSYEVLFINAYKAINEIILCELSEISPKSKKSKEIRSLDYPMLLIDFLRFILEQITYENKFISNIRINELREDYIKFDFEYSEIPDGSALNYDIKAITYHNCRIEEKDGVLSSVVVCDM